ncbi:hypothetical protein CDAR_393591 [Caerostris darwini]|uniref:Uncharacterized protein n=1 Tax=Caerostris darwini TaxID=1538125 RepID=A0AAV4WBE6_9ARAC|nr:hypothetical protein CDAR_393591 [Caerostris darwini]
MSWINCVVLESHQEIHSRSIILIHNNPRGQEYPGTIRGVNPVKLVSQLSNKGAVVRWGEHCGNESENESELCLSPYPGHQRSMNPLPVPHRAPPPPFLIPKGEHLLGISTPRPHSVFQKGFSKP